METLNNVEGGATNSRLEKFDATPREVKVDKIKQMLTPEEAGKLKTKDIDLILNVAQRYLETEKPGDELEEALLVGTIARTEALKTLGGGDSLGSYVWNNEGQVIGVGATDAEAIAKAKDLTQE